MQAQAGADNAQSQPVTADAPVTFSAQQAASPRNAYQAVLERREVLGDQMTRLLNRRDNLTERMHAAKPGSAERILLEKHMDELTTRIVAHEKTLHAADAEVAAAAGVPGATTPSPAERFNPAVDDSVVIMGTIFAGATMLLLAGAWARRLWRGASSVVAQLPPSFEQRFLRLEQSVDAVAIEVERVSEGQRFLHKVFLEQGRAVGAGAAQPIDAHADAEPLRRA